MPTNRRQFLNRAMGTAALGITASAWTQALAAGAVIGDSPYGPLGDPDPFGLRLPAHFSARRIAMSGQTVPGTSHRWHFAPDGGATFPTPTGGWVYVSNAELPQGGAAAIRFRADGSVESAYTILSGTRVNCAGGPTPWGTWLSCEEYGLGRVWECDPQVPGQGIVRPALGRFSHEAAAVDPVSGFVYLTEDADEDSRFYRFRPRQAGDLSSGVLEAALVAADGAVDWVRCSALKPYRGADSTAFARGEGAWVADGIVYFCTTSDNRVWALDTATQRMSVLYDAELLGPQAPLRRPDNVTVHPNSGDVYVGEDADDLQLVLLASAAGERIAAPFLQLIGHDGSEVTGPAFSPDGQRLYFSSQRGTSGRDLGPGMTFEVTGPFRSW